MKKTFLLLPSILIVQSCISIHGSFQGLYSYFEKTKKESPNLILENKKNICEITDANHVYLINGFDLKQCITNKPRSLVYIWTPKCSSKVCIELNVLQEMCDEKNIDLYVVAEYFDTVSMQKKHNTKHPIFAIDTPFYKSNLTAIYRSKFIKDLTEKDTIKERYLYFENGKLVQHKESFEFLDFIKK